MSEPKKISPVPKLTLAAGAAFCLAVALVPVCTSTVTRLLFGFCGLGLALAAGTMTWMEWIAGHADFDAAQREQNKNAVLVAASFLGSILLGLLLVCLATCSVFMAGTATALLWAIGALLGGGFIGFLFSLPKPADETAVPGQRWQVNNSLNRISDALTAALVGVTLVNAGPLFEHFVRAVRHLAKGLAQTAAQVPAAEAFAAGLIVAFTLLGLLGTYLLTRLWIAAALQRAEPGGSAFTGTGVDERDLAILESETRSFSEKERSYSGAAAAVAARIKDLPIEKMRTWREYAAWGKAKSQFGEHADAEKAFEEAVQRYPESAALRLEFAVSLFLAKRDASKDDRRAELNARVRDQLTEAYQRLNGKTAAEVRKNVFKSLTYFWLYEPAPAGFIYATRYGEKYVADPAHLPSGGIWVNLACAYGQNVTWLIGQGGPPAPDAALRAKVIRAIEAAVLLDEAWKIKIQQLLEPASAAGPDQSREDADLGAFVDDVEIRTLVGLPALRPAKAPPTPVPPTPTAPPMILSAPIRFTHRCDASGGAALSADRWVGANDEENILRLYSLDGGPPVDDALLDLDGFLELTGEDGKREADFESAAALGDLIFWIGSHSQSKSGRDRRDRHRLIATKMTAAEDGTPALAPFGQPCKTLRDTLIADARLADFDLAAAAQIAPKEKLGFNLESLCAEHGGARLWIGFRNPVIPAGALLVPLENPRAVVESGAAPELGAPVILDLGGLGFRDMIITGAGYLILAGDYRDRFAPGAQPSRLFAWAGPGSAPQALAVDFGDLNPEALIAFPGEKILIVSDDGAQLTDGVKCKDAPPEKRGFRAALLPVWWPFTDLV